MTGGRTFDKGEGEGKQISTKAVTSTLNASQLTLWPH